MGAGFNEYDNWQASGVSGQGARSFYYPETPQTCSSCHMPLVRSDDPAARDGYVRSHRFPGANTALPFVNRDQAQLDAVQDFLRAGQVSIDVFGITRVAAAPAPAAAVLRGATPPCRARSRSVRSRCSSGRPGACPAGRPRPRSSRPST